MIYFVKPLNDWQAESSFAFYILYCYIFNKRLTKGFSVLHIFLGLWFGVRLHQQSQIISEIAPKDKHLLGVY